MTTYKANRPNRPPTHPGAILREDILPALGLTVKGAAEDLGISRQLLHNILAERASISPDVALRLGRLCGDGPDIWMRMQGAHDVWQAKKKIGNKLKKVPERYKDVA